MVYGDLFINAISSTEYSLMEIYEFGESINSKLQVIWPETQSVVNWPTEETLTDDDVELISHFFLTHFQ